MEHTTNILRLCEGSSAAAHLSSTLPHSETVDPPPLTEFEPVALAARHDGWTPERQRAFIEALADCGIVCEAAARVGMSEQTARRLRRRPDAAGFNRAWDEAVRIGAERLHALAWERAVNGTVRHRYFNGAVVGEERVFDNRLLIYLLGRSYRAGSGAGDVAGRIEGWDQWMGAVEDGLPSPLPGPDADGRSPVWRDEDGSWLTDFPPPPGFAGEQSGEWGDEDYCRSLSPDEEAKVDAWWTRRLDEGSCRRDRYFARLG